jgi:transcriptional regulator with XRE-family HTH domain
MVKMLVIPAQIRAARALLDWSQEQLANAADVALTSVRDIESQKRAADTGTAALIRWALENEGVEFLPGTLDGGPGVRLVANRPNVVRRPTTMTMWDGLPFTIEWQGKEITVFVSRDAIQDLGRHTGREDDAVYLKTFERHRGSILDGVRAAINDPENFDRQGRLHLHGKYIRELA